MVAGASVDRAGGQTELDMVMQRATGRFVASGLGSGTRALVLGWFRICPPRTADHWLNMPVMLQHLLRKGRWDAGAVREDVRALAAQHLG